MEADVEYENFLKFQIWKLSKTLIGIIIDTIKHKRRVSHQ